jgi:hypothetical protein
VVDSVGSTAGRRLSYLDLAAEIPPASNISSNISPESADGNESPDAVTLDTERDC